MLAKLFYRCKSCKSVITLLQNSSSVFSQNESLEDLNISASSVMLSLKADQDSFDRRFEIQVNKKVSYLN